MVSYNLAAAPRPSVIAKVIQLLSLNDTESTNLEAPGVAWPETGSQ